MRDAAMIHRLANDWLAAVVRLALMPPPPPDDLENLLNQNERLKSELTKLHSERVAEQVAQDGLRRHLMLETARFRDELVAAADKPNSPVVVKHHLATTELTDDIYD